MTVGAEQRLNTGSAPARLPDSIWLLFSQSFHDTPLRAFGRCCGQRIQRMKLCLDDLMIRSSRRGLAKISHNENRNMIAGRRCTIEIHAEQPGRSVDLDVAFLAEFLVQCVQQAFAGLNTTARQMPALHIAVPHQENVAFSIKDDAPHAERHAARDPRLEQEKPLRQTEKMPRWSVGTRIADALSHPRSMPSERPPALRKRLTRIVPPAKPLHVSLLLAHLSDPHVGPIQPPRLRELAGKRLTGYVNWRRGRFRIHDMAALERITADLLAQKPEHVALTGDLVNLGLESEFVTARKYVETLGSPDFVSIVPGNHDVYVRSSYKYLAGSITEWMLGDGAGKPSWPYVRIRGGVILIGVNSGIPTAPLLASGAVGKDQMSRLSGILREAALSGMPTVVMIHHPPGRHGASFGRGLRDASAFERVIADQGCDLILHGHNHRHSLNRMKGQRGDVPVVGVASASAVPGSHNHRAGYHLLEIGKKAGRVHISQRTRSLNDALEITETGPTLLVT
jgi:3',5'-cyclic AMP phosphodiesterase CpdA